MTRRPTLIALALLWCSPTTRAQTAQEAQAAIPGVIAAGTRVELIMSGFRALEGPVAAPDGGLYFSDVDASRTYKLEPNGTVSLRHEHTNGANSLYALKDGRLLRTERDSRRVVSVAPDGTVTPIAQSFDGRPFLGPNDLIPDGKGGIYFTDQARRPGPGITPKESGGLYYIRPGGTIVELDDTMRIPNGITLSLDGKVLYVSDSEDSFVFAYDVTPDGGVTNKRRFAMLHHLQADGVRSFSDGMAIDAAGRLYVTGPAGVQVIGRDGAYLGTIRIRGASPTRNVAFGGAGRHTLYTMDRNNLYRVEVLSRGPADRPK
jgi:gluconolactonase